MDDEFRVDNQVNHVVEDPAWSDHTPVITLHLNPIVDHTIPLAPRRLCCVYEQYVAVILVGELSKAFREFCMPCTVRLVPRIKIRSISTCMSC
jgi:hypothetical protein